jgi:hypothetical protein
MPAIIIGEQRAIHWKACSAIGDDTRADGSGVLPTVVLHPGRIQTFVISLPLAGRKHAPLILGKSWRSVREQVTGEQRGRNDESSHGPFLPSSVPIMTNRGGAVTIGNEAVQAIGVMNRRQG